MANAKKLNLISFPRENTSINFGLIYEDPIRSLWRNVLIVALEDAVGRHWRNKSYGNKLWC